MPSGLPIGAPVPALRRAFRHPTLLTPAARKAVRQRMLLLRQSSVDRVGEITGVTASDLKRYRRDLMESGIPDLLIQRGAGLPFAQELPQGGLLYLMVRAARPERVVETGVRPGYSTVWILSALEANGVGELVSLGPGPTAGRSPAVHDVTVGQFVAPSLRGRWTLVLGNSEGQLRTILGDRRQTDFYFFDNGPNVAQARSELRVAWASLSDRGIVLAHHVDSNSAWAEFCRLQGVLPQVLDPGPPPMGALSMRTLRA